jgi:hypothetical protein
LGNTISNIPTRLQTWDATKYLPQNATYYYKFDGSKPTALEVIDPGCIVCQHLFKNIKSADFESKYNLTYIAYPIKNPDSPGKYKFVNSYVVAQYLEAIAMNPLTSLKTPADWQVLEKIYTGKDNDGTSYQIKINTMLSADQTRSLISSWLKEMGYDSNQLKQVETDANSQKVANIIKQNQDIVNNKIKTVKIPTLIFNGQLHSGLVGTSDLH